jgi:hypothetical protein
MHLLLKIAYSKGAKKVLNTEELENDDNLTQWLM